MKRIIFLALAAFFIAACQSEEEKKDEELRQKIDDAVVLSGNQNGQFKLISKGPVLDTTILVSGNESFKATLDQGKNSVTGRMITNNIGVDYGFEGTELGYRSVNGQENYILLDLSIDSVQMEDVSLESAKVALRRVQPDNFVVGNYTGVLNIDGKLHTFRIEFETPLHELTPVQ